MIGAGFVFILSIFEIIAAMKEIHEHLSEIKGRMDLEEIVRNAMNELEKPTVKNVVEKVLSNHPEESKRKNEIYHIACQLLDEKG